MPIKRFLMSGYFARMSGCSMGKVPINVIFEHNNRYLSCF